MNVETMISKIKIIKGDCSLVGLGISDDDRYVDKFEGFNEILKHFFNKLATIPL